jgi:hypothetical protein
LVEIGDHGGDGVVFIEKNRLVECFYENIVPFGLLARKDINMLLIWRVADEGKSKGIKHGDSGRCIDVHRLDSRVGGRRKIMGRLDGGVSGRGKHSVPAG